MITIEIPVRELHSRTGHYVRKASRNMEVIVTDRGRAIARLSPLVASQQKKALLGARRILAPGYRELLASGALKNRVASADPSADDRAVRDL
jgi:antitoxin (DNA-binding transcriptional repressor) of toxin-antitoxin stability system